MTLSKCNSGTTAVAHRTSQNRPATTPGWVIKTGREQVLADVTGLIKCHFITCVQLGESTGRETKKQECEFAVKAAGFQAEVTHSEWERLDPLHISGIFEMQEKEVEQCKQLLPSSW